MKLGIGTLHQFQNPITKGVWVRFPLLPQYFFKYIYLVFYKDKKPLQNIQIIKD